MNCDDVMRSYIVLKAQCDHHRITAKRLHEALEELVAHQNGCPLPSYEDGWNRAMELAEAALEEYDRG